MRVLTGTSETCPHCGANLIAGPIPEKDQAVFGGAKYFLRVIGIELNRDRVEFWECPDCGKTDPCFAAPEPTQSTKQFELLGNFDGEGS